MSIGHQEIQLFLFPGGYGYSLINKSLRGKRDQDCDLWLHWNFSFRFISMMNVQLLQETISFA